MHPSQNWVLQFFKSNQIWKFKTSNIFLLILLWCLSGLNCFHILVASFLFVNYLIMFLTYFPIGVFVFIAIKLFHKIFETLTLIVMWPFSRYIYFFIVQIFLVKSYYLPMSFSLTLEKYFSTLDQRHVQHYFYFSIVLTLFIMNLFWYGIWNTELISS